MLAGITSYSFFAANVSTKITRFIVLFYISYQKVLLLLLYLIII